MTTRRRRAGSESSPFDSSSEQQQQETDQPGAANIDQLTPVIAEQIQNNPLHSHQQIHNLTSLSSWGTTTGPTATPQEAYYKKTDSPLPTTPSIFTPTNLNTHNFPNQYNNSNTTNTTNNGYNPWHNFSEGISSYIGTNFNTSAFTGRSEVESGVSDLLEVPELGNEYSGGDTSSMACRDRSSEFAGIIRSQQQGHLSNGAARGGAVSKGAKDIRQYSAFMQRSRGVGNNISITYAKLEKLTQLARKRSLFDDSQDGEVQELTAMIRHDLGYLTKQLEDLRSTSSSSSSQTSAHMQKHSANLVGSLQTKVASITHKFRDVLEVRTENLKRQAERRNQFTGTSAALVGGAGGGGGGTMMGGAHNPSVLLADEAKAAAATRRQPNGDVVVDFDGVASGGGGATSGSGMYQNQLMLMEEQESVIMARAETMKTIESTIVELGTMFTQLATMVKEQDEYIGRIDSNVDDAEMNVEAAHTELLKYFKNVSSNRWLMLKVFGIVVVFFIIFVVFMA